MAMQQDTRALLRTGTALFLTGAMSATLIFVAFGGITRRGRLPWRSDSRSSSVNEGSDPLGAPLWRDLPSCDPRLLHVEHHLIDVTPSPRIPRLDALHYRMSGVVKVLRRVLANG
jgi:hypothetical protein